MTARGGDSPPRDISTSDWRARKDKIIVSILHRNVHDLYDDNSAYTRTCMYSCVMRTIEQKHKMTKFNIKLHIDGSVPLHCLIMFDEKFKAFTIYWI